MDQANRKKLHGIILPPMKRNLKLLRFTQSEAIGDQPSRDLLCRLRCSEQPTVSRATQRLGAFYGNRHQFPIRRLSPFRNVFGLGMIAKFRGLFFGEDGN